MGGGATTIWPHGLLSALVTPMDAAQELSLGILPRLIDQQLDSGVAGFVVGGGTGEFGALSVAERIRLAEAAIAAVDGRAPVIVQTGALATRDVLELSRHAADIGAIGQLTASPFGESISWDERLAFYATLDAQTTVPIMLYNTPPAGVLTFDQIRELAALPNVSAVKDSSGQPDLLGDLIEWAGDDFAVYVGADTLLYDAVLAGARGAVFGTPNVAAAELSATARDLHEHGSTADNLAAWHRLRPFLRAMELSPNYMSACKALSARLGIDVGPVRAPYLPSSVDEVDRLESLLRRAAG
jgi:4-hydroxy-tetrahydrodipicolinate synthase